MAAADQEVPVSRFPFFWISVVVLIGAWLVTAYSQGSWPFGS